MEKVRAISAEPVKKVPWKRSEPRRTLQSKRSAQWRHKPLLQSGKVANKKRQLVFLCYSPLFANLCYNFKIQVFKIVSTDMVIIKCFEIAVENVAVCVWLCGLYHCNYVTKARQNLKLKLKQISVSCIKGLPAFSTTETPVYVAMKPGLGRT
jgi:hypothetical protein